MSTRIDALVFWACSARIMWCFFYRPNRLPRSYVKWIMSLANVDKRLLRALRVLRTGEWSYIRGSSDYGHLLTSYSKDLGHPTAWGDPHVLPAYGGSMADAVWKNLGVQGRDGIGGLPCELVHAGVAAKWGLGESCGMNAVVRAVYAFIEAMAIYVPVHFLPILLTQPRSLLRIHRVIPALLSAMRSSAFLSTFVSSYWLSVCITRTLLFARLFPWISHDIWDGAFGCVLAGSLTCGASIWIENGHRRGEISLYVLPRALRASLPSRWIKGGNRGARIVERMIFILSLASLLTTASHRPDVLRGLSRWAFAFIMKKPRVDTGESNERQIAAYPPATESAIPEHAISSLLEH
ncbi:hypothetical protein SERLA73DRAFT_176142 [Serpula lacrymans var. lacrymans S7.3]|uniref:Transmembrane protein 135 N-terminal domain-containing protein n=2 Tax=Serpula lacrymans var. lacrymans TaxID=341189 RepID=F8PMD9_SERL3|nr:uncharacterized protein SERLADRAFT_458912 [Serpula lacrymans var. lacrymans S7.9]EGO02771.1 hypothetical protein SERLA73DRAFT_176142 [Serpula lacrymans var. lacrymans S7.3]EGO28472.1 hypothetical protein SERLADRAFT_458912 [Serpula lacrymans var. lacrymans S7.9]